MVVYIGKSKDFMTLEVKSLAVKPPSNIAEIFISVKGLSFEDSHYILLVLNYS